MEEKIEIEVGVLCALLMSKYLTLSTQEKLEWLDDNSVLLCDFKLSRCFEEVHNIDENSVYNPMVKAFWGNIDNAIYKIYTVAEIRNLIGNTCYEEHIEFEFDYTSNNCDINASRKKYNTNPYCTYYSAPLFRNIIEMYNLGDQDTFQFTKAKTTTGATILVFKVVSNGDNRTYSTYNISTDPGFREMSML